MILALCVILILAHNRNHNNKHKPFWFDIIEKPSHVKCQLALIVNKQFSNLFFTAIIVKNEFTELFFINNFIVRFALAIVTFFNENK